MDTIQCNYCGYRIPPGARYCPGCASPVEDDEKTTIMQRTPHPLPQAGAQPLNQGYGMPQQQPQQQPQQYPQGYSQSPYNQGGYNTLPSPPKRARLASSFSLQPSRCWCLVEVDGQPTSLS